MIKRIAILSAAAWLSGCGVPAKSYYVLSSDGPAPAGGGTAIGVGPVSVAEYLDRPNLVIAESNHQLGIAESHRWSGDLSSAVARVTAANLGRRLHTGNVRTYPWQRDNEINYQVVLDVRQMHGGADGYAVIEAGWRVYRLPDRKLAASRTFAAREPAGSDGYEAVVAAESRLLARLADEIAREIK